MAEVETSFATWDRISPGDGAAPESWKLVANLTSLVVQLWLGRSPTNGEHSSVLASEMHPVLLSHDSSLDVEGYNVIKFFRPGSVTQHWLSRVPYSRRTSFVAPKEQQAMAGRLACQTLAWMNRKGFSSN